MSNMSQQNKECHIDIKRSILTPTANELLIKKSYYQKDIHNSEVTIDLKLYKRRWLILMLFVMYSFCNGVQWIQYAIISNLISKYFGVSSWEVDLTSMIYMITYLSLAIPVSYLMDKLDLKTSAIIGVSGTAIGSWIKVWSCSPARFYLSLTGQTFVAVSQIFMLTVPSKLASVWFGNNEVSSACGIATFGTQFGAAVSFFLSPLLVRDHEDATLIGDDLRFMFISIASFSTLVAFIVLFFFQSEPMKPPSYSEACKMTAAPAKSREYFMTFKKLLIHPKTLMIFTTAGINNGCFNALSTLLNQIFIFYFSDDDTSAGMIGTSMIISGMFSSIIFGFVIDKTKKFREINLTVYYLCAVSVLIFMQALEWKNLIAVYLSAATVGIFLSGFTSVSLAYIPEVTYPESELLSSTIMYLLGCIFGIILTISIRTVNEIFGVYYGLLSLGGILLIGALMMTSVDLEYKRQNANKNKTAMHTECPSLDEDNIYYNSNIRSK